MSGGDSGALKGEKRRKEERGKSKGWGNALGARTMPRPPSGSLVACSERIIGHLPILLFTAFTFSRTIAYFFSFLLLYNSLGYTSCVLQFTHREQYRAASAAACNTQSSIFLPPVQPLAHHARHCDSPAQHPRHRRHKQQKMASQYGRLHPSSGNFSLRHCE